MTKTKAVVLVLVVWTLSLPLIVLWAVLLKHAPWLLYALLFGGASTWMYFKFLRI
jgi:hypothetical protein